MLILIKMMFFARQKIQSDIPLRVQDDSVVDHTLQKEKGYPSNSSSQ